MAGKRRGSDELLLLLCMLIFGFMPLLVAVVAAVAVTVPPLSAFAIPVDPSEPTDTPFPTGTPTPTASATPTPTTTPRSPVPVTGGPSPTMARPTVTVTPRNSPTPTSTPCPRLEAKIEAQGQASTTLLVWSWVGGCGPVTGTLTARYAGEREPYQTYRVQRNPGQQPDSPPPRCEGTFTIVYVLSLWDAKGQSVAPTAERRVTWVC